MAQADQTLSTHTYVSLVNRSRFLTRPTDLHSVTLHSLLHLHLIKPSSLLQQRIFGPLSKRHLIGPLMHIRESCGFDAGSHVVEFVAWLSGRCERPSNDFVPAGPRGSGIESAVVTASFDARFELLDPAARC